MSAPELSPDEAAKVAAFGLDRAEESIRSRDVLPTFIRRHELVIFADRGGDDYGAPDTATDDIDLADGITSRMERDWRGEHRPVLDIDFDAALLPSSTPGHWHLVLDKPMSWSDYRLLLEVLAKVGVIEQGFADASIDRKYSNVRLPWVRKDGHPHV